MYEINKFLREQSIVIFSLFYQELKMAADSRFIPRTSLNRFVPTKIYTEKDAGFFLKMSNLIANSSTQLWK